MCVSISTERSKGHSDLQGELINKFHTSGGKNLCGFFFLSFLSFFLFHGRWRPDISAAPWSDMALKESAAAAFSDHKGP